MKDLTIPDSERLPRIRGDRPPDGAGLMYATGATPHTRGSTLKAAIAAQEQYGYPAYAGIDPEPYSYQREGVGLPRIRGDRPAGAGFRLRSQPATPHTRGSTPGKGLPLLSTEGYPAYAGIDLLHSHPKVCSIRLPRIRGDRPFLTQGYNTLFKATPHTRGSTLFKNQPYSKAWGYPAYAGIDPSYLVNLVNDFRLPRIRGDRPYTNTDYQPAGRATPHTRGSTLPILPDDCTWGGYPAYAGIDPTFACIYSRRSWLPRIRGDRPRALDCWHTVVGATPHTRGSTLLYLRPLQPTIGYPAYAGIDPLDEMLGYFIGWLPRIRGDRPVSIHAPERGATAAPQTRGIFFS